MTAALQPVPSAPSLRDLIAAEARAHAARLNVSGRTLARRLNKDQTWVSRRFNGVIPMDADDIEMVAGGLGITVEELLRDAIRRLGSSAVIGADTAR